MSKWRYTARMHITSVDNFGRKSPAEKTSYYDYLIESEKEGLEGLKDFLSSRKSEVGPRLRWVTLERSTGENWYVYTDWEEVKRLVPPTKNS